MAVSVIVASWNQLTTLPLTLASLANQNELPAEVIVADDGSADGTLDWLDGLGDGAYPFPIRYTTDEHRGYGLTVSENRAAKAASNNLLLFTNADVIHNPMSVASHAAVGGRRIAGGLIREINRAAAAEFQVIHLKDWKALEAIANSNLTDLSNNEYFIRDPAINMYGVWGGNFSVPKLDFDAVGGFNEQYVGLYGGEEADLIQRLRKTGVHIAWAYGSVSYHLAHRLKEYRLEAGGNKKYRAEYPQ